MPATAFWNCRAALVCTLFLAGLTAPSAQASDGRFFLRGEVGDADSDFEVPSLDVGETDRSDALRGGYYFNDYLAAEAYYAKLYRGRLYESAFAEFSLDAELEAYGVGAVAKKRFGEDRGFYIEGHGGLASVSGKFTSVSNPCANPLGCRFVTVKKFRSTAPYFGIGAGYDFNERVGVGLRYDKHRAGFGGGYDVDVKGWSVGVEIRF